MKNNQGKKMKKTLKKMLEVYEPKAGDEKKFKDKHIVVKTKDANGNGDDVFQGTNVKAINRSDEGHGYNPKEDEKVYEEIDQEEDQEQIDELKRSTLKSYIAKKMDNIYSNKYPSKDKVKKNVQSLQRAHDRVVGVAPTSEETEIKEGPEAHAQYLKYHADTAKLLKNIQTGLNKHKSAVSTKSTYTSGQAHWGHVGTMKDIHRSLQDIHDRVLENGEYAKPPQPVKMREETEVNDSTIKLLELYAELSEENQQAMIEIIESGQSDELLSLIEEQVNG